MIITINRSPDWALTTLPVGAVINLPASLADPLILAGQAVPTPGAAITHTDPFGSSGGSGGTGTGHIQTVYATLAAAAAANPAVGIGTTVYIGSAPADYVKYEVTATPSSTPANWQALAANYSNTLATLALTPGKPHTLYLTVPAASTGDRVTITVDGSSIGVFLPSAQTHVIPLGDAFGAAAPATVGIQRTTGSGTVGSYSLDDGPTYSVFAAPAITYATILAAYPERGAMPAAGVILSAADMNVDVVSDGVFWTPSRTPQFPKWVDASQPKWLSPANCISMSTTTGQGRTVFRASWYRMPGDRPGYLDAISFATNGAGAVGAGSDEFDLRIYPCQPDGSVLTGTVPYVIKFNSGGTGGAGQTVWDSLGTNVTGCLANVGVGVKELHGVFPGGQIAVPWGFYGGIYHNMGTSPALSSPSALGLVCGAGPLYLNAGGWPDETSSNPNRMPGYTWAESWVAGGTATPWPAGAAYVQGGVISPRFRVTG